MSAEYNRTDLLISLIDNPTWRGKKSDGGTFAKTAKDTLIPDLVSIVRRHEDYQFVIFDAKYYNMTLEIHKPLAGQPGIESVTKQYMYQLAYRKFV